LGYEQIYQSQDKYQASRQQDSDEGGHAMNTSEK